LRGRHSETKQVNKVLEPAQISIVRNIPLGTPTVRRDFLISSFMNFLIFKHFNKVITVHHLQWDPN